VGKNVFREEGIAVSYELKIKSGRVYQEGGFKELEIGIKDGRIAGVGLDLPQGKEEEDFGNNMVIPGVIDGHVHFREPGDTEKEDFRSGSRAAVRGGVTTVVDMPNNDPPIKTEKLFREKKRSLEVKSLVNFALYSGIPKDLTEIRPILKAGAVGFKYYMAEEEVDMEELTRRIDESGALLAVHAEDPEYLLPFGSPEGPSEYLDSRPAEAEISAVSKLMNDRPERLHVVHVTLPETVSRLGDKVTQEVTPHHLILSRADLELDDFKAVTNPPIRNSDEVSGLQECFSSGKIKMIASDHAPHRPGEKLTDNPEIASPGIPGVETILPLSLTYARENNLPISLPIEALTARPAEVFGFSKRGRIKEGYWADLTVVESEVSRKIRGENFFSKARVTPFEGHEVSYWPQVTYVNGTQIYREGKLNESATGDFLGGSLNV